METECDYAFHFQEMPTLMDEVPYVAMVFDEKRPFVCSCCFKYVPSGLKRCRGCQLLYYCGAECQKNDWVDHKTECKALSGSGDVPYLFLMVGRITRKISQGDYGSSYNGRTWNSLEDNLTEFRRNRDGEMTLLLQFLSKIMGSEAHDLSISTSIYEKIQTNLLTITAPDMPEKLGVGIFLGISVHNHSCDSQQTLSFQGKKAYILSDDLNATLNPQMTICYVPMFPLSIDRRKQLREQHFFECQCRFCTDSSREQWGRSAFANCCPKGVAIKGSNSEIYKCVVCGKASHLPVAEIERSIEELDENLNKRKPSEDIIAEIEYCQELFEKYQKILSPYNYWLVDLSDRIVALAEDIDLEDLTYKNRQDVHRKFAHFSLNAIRHYFPSGRWLLQGLLNAAAGYLPLEPPYSRNTLKLFKEVKELSTRVYGPEHHISQCYALAVTEYSKLLRR